MVNSNQALIMETIMQQFAALLSEFDLHLALDISGSILTTDTATKGKTRLEYMRELVIGVASAAAEVDDDGTDVYLFGGRNGVTHHTGLDGVGVAELLDNCKVGGSTPTAEVCQAIIDVAQGKPKNSIAIIFTDGVPNDRSLLKTVIREQAMRQATDERMTFFFVQVGDDKQATQDLDELDNNLGATKDIVAVATVDKMISNEANIFEMILNAVKG
jgi:hypothetical protein